MTVRGLLFGTFNGYDMLEPVRADAMAFASSYEKTSERGKRAC